ncbi:hypothetical protein M885DRAFT_611600 [Pelagophyceae sp. CCMP2097]|nr:hypothetical protein M885DRAFT_611600 [Pelagophyceae sp. CCMP2097]
MRAAWLALAARLLGSPRRVAALPSAIFDAALREAPALMTVEEEFDRLTAAGYTKARFFKAVERDYNLTKRYSSYALPANSSTEALTRWRRPLRVLALGDSIASEICAAVVSTTSNWNCVATMSNWILNDFKSKALFEKSLPNLLAAHDVIWFTEGYHYMFRDFRSPKKAKPSLKGVPPSQLVVGRLDAAGGYAAHASPQLERETHMRRVLETVQRTARASAASGKLIVVSTAMVLDPPVLLAYPAKRDFDKFSDFSLAEAWGRLDERVGVEAGIDAEPNVVVAPLWRLAKRHIGSRCDGMHYGSWVEGVSGKKHVGVYGPFIAAVANAFFDLHKDGLNYAPPTELADAREFADK